MPDVDEEPPPRPGLRSRPVAEDVGDGHVALEPERRGGVGVEHAVALAPWQLPGDQVMNALNRVVHGGTSHRGGSDGQLQGQCGRARPAAIRSSRAPPAVRPGAGW